MCYLWLQAAPQFPRTSWDESSDLGPVQVAMVPLWHQGMNYPDPLAGPKSDVVSLQRDLNAAALPDIDSALCALQHA